MIAEENMLRMAAKILTPDDVVLEAGGDRGDLAAALAPLCARIWSMEADPERDVILAERLRSIPNADAVHGALVANRVVSEVEFHLDPYRPGSSLLPLIERTEDTTILVPAIDADTFIRAHGITALVLDIERYEYILLPRLLTLVQVRAVVIEWHPNGAIEQTATLANYALEMAGLKRVAHDSSDWRFPVSGYVRMP